MKGFCPSCEKESELEQIRRKENLNIKGETIPVDVDYFVCMECGVEFDNPAIAYDPLKIAYQEYRRRKGMVQPEEIRAFREKYGLTQRELSILAGLGGATISRYENGSLQDEAHDTLLRLLLQPKDLLKILEEKEGGIDPEKRRKIMEQLSIEIRRADLLCFLQDSSQYQSPSILNGFQVIDIQKLLAVVIRLCFHSRVAKTKLNKLLFYVDFLNYKNHQKSITGLCYVHLPLGPVPDQYETIFEALLKLDDGLTKSEELYENSIGEYYSYSEEPQSSELTYSEGQVIFQVMEQFKSYYARDIVSFSHKEEGYLQTGYKEIISYEYADSLNI